MSWSIDEAAQVMGMAPHEVLAVAEVGDYHVVTTHDGQHTLVTEEGEAKLLTAEDAAKLGVDEGGELEELADAAEDADPAKTAEGSDLDPNAAEIAERARQALENGGQGPTPSAPVPNPEAGGLPPNENSSDGDEDPVPDANKDDLLAWVGDDSDRAARALEAEKERSGGPRSTVVAALEKVAQA
ncbi:hypothetical protein SAMN04489727_1720 [Amycolatopsis tolypomycina]|uniref:Uncharacterized protein n=1 Tax=Amycolatopsis tolypomycina TaxID=208445 RepID=A0A1H4JBS6_9PSEU|nr:hypothetical protein [Amycolatopsis tolypomycina]SEB43515.1 hypothetical protein SAMN04489727_1720 [Amycolatopsis tolypomycina]